MGFTTDLLTGFARHLDVNGVGTFRADGIYQPGETGIVFRTMPDQPDRVISLATYGVDDALVEGMDTIGLQVRTRWSGADPRPGDDLADSIFELWHSAHDLELPYEPPATAGVFVKQLTRRSQTSSGGSTAGGAIDSNRRWSTIQNFYAELARPTQHRP